MKPTKELMAEHEGVMMSLDILERICERMDSGGSADVDHIQQLLEFYRVFVDRCHHGKEEDYLFPEMEKSGVPKKPGPIGVMLEEHEIGRGLVRRMAAETQTADDPDRTVHFTGTAREYISLLRNHIQKENTILFPLADQRLSPSQQASISGGFEKIETERVGEGRHEAFHRMLDELGRVYL